MKTAEDFKGVSDIINIFIMLKNDYIEDFHKQANLAEDENKFVNWAVSHLRAYNRVWNGIRESRPELALSEDGFQKLMKHLLSDPKLEMPETFKRALSYIKS